MARKEETKSEKKPEKKPKRTVTFEAFEEGKEPKSNKKEKVHEFLRIEAEQEEKGGKKRNMVISGKIRKPVREKKKMTKKEFFKGLLFAVLLAAWVLAGIILGSIIVSVIIGNFLTQEELEMPLYSAIYSAAMYLVSAAIIVTVPWLVSKKMKPKREELGLKGYPTWTDILLSPVAYFIYALVGGLLLGLFQSMFDWFDVDQAQDVGFNNLGTTAELRIAFVALVIVAPILEEFIFRGYLYGKIREKIPVPLAVLIVSLLFAFLHGQWNVAVDTFVLSLALCAQRELTGTIYSGILLHMIKNGIAYYVLFIAGG